MTTGCGEFKVPLRAATTTVCSICLRHGSGLSSESSVHECVRIRFAVPDDCVMRRYSYFLLDLDLNRVVDVVNLDDMVTSMDITTQLVVSDRVSPACLPVVVLTRARFGKPTASTRRRASQATLGIVDQIQVSRGHRRVGQGFWRSYNSDPYAGRNKDKAIRFGLFFRGKTARGARPI